MSSVMQQTSIDHVRYVGLAKLDGDSVKFIYMYVIVCFFLPF